MTLHSSSIGSRKWVHDRSMSRAWSRVTDRRGSPEREARWRFTSAAVALLVLGALALVVFEVRLTNEDYTSCATVAVLAVSTLALFAGVILTAPLAPPIKRRVVVAGSAALLIVCGFLLLLLPGRRSGGDGLDKSGKPRDLYAVFVWAPNELS